MAYGGEGGVMIRMGCRVEVVLTGGLRHFDPTVCILSIIAFFSSIFVYDRVLLMYLLPQFPSSRFFVLLGCLCVFLQYEKKRLID